MNIRMDSEVKEQAQKLFAQFGLDMTTAINLFLRQAIRERSIPFELRLERQNSYDPTAEWTPEQWANMRQSIVKGNRLSFIVFFMN